MPNNNTEATTYIKFSAQESTTFSYSALTLNSSENDIDQLEVVREFLWHSPAASATAPDAEELKTVHVLGYANKSGSPMWSIDTTAKTITFNTAAGNFTWLNGTHHSRGVDVDLPVYADGDTVTIRRKTQIKNKNQQWTTGAKVTAARLNSQFSQALNLIQEIRSFLLNPVDFDTYIGNAGGICPLDSNNKVPLKHIPSSLGGSAGEATVDVSGNTIGQLSNVSSSSETAGDTLVYSTSAGAWEPKTAITGVVAVSGATDGHILNWNNSGTAWALSAFSLGTMTDVTLASQVQGDVLFWNGSYWKNSSMTAPTSGQILAWNGSKWNPVTFSADVTSTELATHSVSELGDVFYPPSYDWREMDFMAYFGGNTDAWRPKSVDIFDLNDVKYEGAGNVGSDIEAGWTMAWDPTIPKQDGQNGCFVFGEFGNKHEGINVSTATKDQVLRIQVVDGLKKWAISDFRLNHLSDVDANTSQEHNGHVLSWDSNQDKWVPIEGSGGSGTTTQAAIACSITYDGGERYPNGSTGANNDFFYTWSPPVSVKLDESQYLYGVVQGEMDSGGTTGYSGSALAWEIRKSTWEAMGDGWNAATNFLPDASHGSDSTQLYFKTTGGKLRRKLNTAPGAQPTWLVNQWNNSGLLSPADVLLFKPVDCGTPLTGGSNYRPPMTVNLAFKEVE